MVFTVGNVHVYEEVGSVPPPTDVRGEDQIEMKQNEGYDVSVTLSCGVKVRGN